MPLQRLTRFLSQNGVASRRKSEELVLSGRVKVNNHKVSDIFAEVNPHDDIVTIDNVTVLKRTIPAYFALHKPKRFLSDLATRDDRPLARSLIPGNDRLFPVGRLDYDSEGLMIFTNDGPFANKVMHPRYEAEREYEAKVARPLSESEVTAMLQGLELDDGPAKARSVRYLRTTRAAHARYSVVITEGRNRMVRRMFAKLGVDVLKLRRTRIGGVRLGSLKTGEYRALTAAEIRSLLGNPDNRKEG